MLARDASNYSAMPLALDAWKADGVGLVIAQAVAPPAQFPPTQTRAQIDACLAAGLHVDIYVYLWFALDDIAAKLALLSGYEGQIRQLWLDVEDTAAKYYDTTVCEQRVAAALALCDAFPTSGGAPTGIYSGHWFWTPTAYMGNSEAFKDRKLWDANYDQVADTTAGFAPYGGWTSAAIKQYAGSQPDGTDLDVLSAAEEASLAPPAPLPEPAPEDPCAALEAAHDALVVTVADVCDRIGDLLLAEANATKHPMRRWYVRQLVQEMVSERVQSIGPRPT